VFSRLESASTVLALSPSAQSPSIGLPPGIHQTAAANDAASPPGVCAPAGHGSRAESKMLNLLFLSFIGEFKKKDRRIFVAPFESIPQKG
jgi:hypothetical protein